MAQAYEHLAEVYEKLNDDCGYAEWADYFIRTLKELGAEQNGLELGCGSGYFCRALVRAGYSMSGADISPAMLTQAERLARAEGVRAKFFLADAAALKTPERYDFILSPNDCFNYIPPRTLKRAFEGVRRRIKEGGYFLFDISSAYKLRRMIADTVCADDREDVTYLSFNTLKGDSVEMDVTLFVKRQDGAFDRFDERHIQYIHTEEEVLEALFKAGFEVLAVEGHLGREREGSDRLNFLCKR